MALGPQAARFLERYREGWDDLKGLAELAKDYVAQLLAPGNFDLHGIVARAKSPESARAKILAKKYGHPAMQLTDQIGVRVITYSATDVDRVAASLRDMLDVDDRHSSDKRSALALREFGYRSVHLIGKVRSQHLELLFRPLADQRLEIQVRSILEHAWAEIEHELVYKAGIEFPDAVRRRFSAIAGTLEILEMEFDVLRRQRDDLIAHYAADAQNGHGFDADLDAARLLGILEILRPEGISWRASREAGSSFPPRVEATCVRALAAVGIGTGVELRECLESVEFQTAAATYAAAQGRVPAQLSHLTITVLAVAARDGAAASEFMPELSEHVLAILASGT